MNAAFALGVGCGYTPQESASIGVMWMGQTRNIGFVGHSGSGKTTLAAKLLEQAGEKEIQLDASPEEKRRGYSIDLAVCACNWKDTKLNLLVAPGLGEFIEETIKAVYTADLVVLVVHGEKPVEVVTEQAWEVIARAKKPVLVFVNMMDRPEADPAKALEGLREGLNAKFWPIQWPIRENGELTGVVDLLSGEARGPKGGTSIPEAIKGHVEELKSQLIEEIASLDDVLAEKFLSDEEISPEELASALAKGVADGTFVPVLWGSAEAGVGMSQLLDVLRTLAPEPEAEETLRLWTFNILSDPYLGRIAFVRVSGGELSEGNAWTHLRTGNKVQIRDIYTLKGTKLEKTGKAAAGDIAALGKLEDIALGDTIAVEGAEPFPEPPFPKPVFSRAVYPKSQGDEEKLSTAMRDIVSTKVTLKFERDNVTKEAILSGMGDVQLDVVRERLKNRYNVEVELRIPKIPYLETIKKQATAQYRHKKQTGGHGQFGEVHLRIEPLPRGEGFQFLDETKGGVIPQQFIPGVEKGVREAMQEGVLAGYPMVDIKAVVFYGMYHPVDSSELSFKIAARQAFKLAAEKAEPALLEPIMLLTVIAPEAFTGDIISDLNARRGKVLGMESQDGKTVVKAEVPLAELLSYALDLKSMTQGRASFQMEFLRYDFVPAQLQEKIVAEANAAKESS